MGKLALLGKSACRVALHSAEPRTFNLYVCVAAAHGGSVTELGNQIFVLLQKGQQYPMLACDVRCCFNSQDIFSYRDVHLVCSWRHFTSGGQDQEALRKLKEVVMRKMATCRIKYEQTVGDIKKAVEKKLKIPVENQQLFWQNKELTKARDGTTLLDLGLHTGASLKGYDLVYRCSLLNADIIQSCRNV